MEDENLLIENEENLEKNNFLEILEENNLLVKKSLSMLIGFFSLSLLSIFFFIYFQTNKFFIFTLNRSYDNIPNPMVTKIFSIVFIVIILIGIIAHFILLKEYFKRRDYTEEQKVESFDFFKKIFSLCDMFNIVPTFLVIVMIINGFLFSFAQVDGPSMQPTFCDGDPVIIRYVDIYEDDDIVVFEVNKSGSIIYLIKRIVAIPGDKLVVNSSGVWVNDELVESNVSYVNFENYINIDSLEEGYYFVLGDNRNNSTDSRILGLIEYDKMIGKVVFKISNATCQLN